MKSKSVLSGMIWRLTERFSISFVQFALQIVLARLLSPEHYGVLSIMIIFTSLATVFVQAGFNTALIQNKDVTEEDYSSVLWVALIISAAMYGIIFVCAPFIGMFYEMPELVSPLRILSLMLFPGALNSVQLAKVSRDMDFQKIFFSNVGAVVVSGVVGVAMAAMGLGVWALVGQSISNVVVACVVMRFTVKLKLRFVCNWKRVGVLLSYGWKILASNLLDTLYQDIRSLVIGKKYDSGTLGYYNRGKQFPQFIITAVNSSVQSVLLPAFSKKQDDKTHVKAMMRRAIAVNSYIIFPIMAGLAAAAEPITRLLLTEKWLPCVPYMQIYCATMAFYPVHTSNLQAINAVGRSDIYLKLELIKKGYGILFLIAAVVFFDSPIMIAATGLITTVISFFVNAGPNKKLVQYSYWEQIRDLLPSLSLSLVMAAGVYAMNFLMIPDLLKIAAQGLVGVALYIGLSFVFRVDSLRYILTTCKTMLAKKESRESVKPHTETTM